MRLQICAKRLLVVCMLVAAASLAALCVGASAGELAEGVVVVSSSQFVFGDYLYIVGEVRNDTAGNVQSVRVTATYFNETGGVLGTGLSYTQHDILTPGQVSPFRIAHTPPPGYSRCELAVQYSTTTEAPMPPLTILSTREWTDSTGSLWLVGEVQNTTASTLQYVKLAITLYDLTGTVTNADYTYASINPLLPGQKSPFRTYLIAGPTDYVTRTISTNVSISSSEPLNLRCVNVTHWVDSYGWPHFAGQVQNDGTAEAKFVQVVLTLYDDDGHIVNCDYGYTSPTTIPAGGVAAFEVYFAGNFAGWSSYALYPPESAVPIPTATGTPTATVTPVLTPTRFRVYMPILVRSGGTQIGGTSNARSAALIRFSAEPRQAAAKGWAAESNYTVALPLVLKRSAPITQWPTPTPTLTLSQTLTPTPTSTPTATPTGVADVKIQPSCSQFDAPFDDNLNLAEEYVCLYNRGTASANMTGWQVKDAADHTYTFPTFTLLPAASVKVRTGCGTDRTTDLYWCQTTEVWDNWGDTAYLYNSTGILVDSYTYGSGTPTPTPSLTPTPQSTATQTATPGPTHTITPASTSTLTPVATPTATATQLPTRTLTPTSMPTQSSTSLPTHTRTSGPTQTEAPTRTTVPSPTHTRVPIPTATPTESPGVCECYANLYNCSDFTTQAAAQACFDHCMAEVGYDVHQLDADNDGIACESLP